MQELRPGVHPLKNLYFIESDEVRFEGNTLTELVNAVWGYRRRAGLPEGDPFAEVQQQICVRDPGACQEVAVLNRQPVAEDRVLLGKVSARAAELLDLRMQKKLRFVSRAEADVRADKCASCPFNVDYSGCTSCQKNLEDILAATLTPQLTHERLNKRACRLAGEELSVSVYVDGQTFLNEAPSHCWRNPIDL